MAVGREASTLVQTMKVQTADVECIKLEERHHKDTQCDVCKRMEDDEEKVKPKPVSFKKKLSLAVLVTLTTGFLTWLYMVEEVSSINQYLFSFLTWIEDQGNMGPIICMIAFAVATVFFVPGTFLNFGAGFSFGVVVGYLSVAAGSMIGASIAYFLGKTLAREWIEQSTSPTSKFRMLERAMVGNNKMAFKMVLLARLPPFFPFTFINYAFGTTRVPFSVYFVASWIGLLPSTLLDAYIGSAMRNFADITAGEEDGVGAGFWGGLVCTILVTAYISWEAKKALSDATKMSEAKDEATSYRKCSCRNAETV